SPVPGHLPPLTLPEWELAPSLISAAAACAVLSLVESSSVARSIASDTGQRIDASVEFAGQGLANVAAGLTGGFATSGSLTRSGLNHRIGARTRLSSTLSGVMMLAVLVSLGPVVDHTPIPVLAGVLFVVAADLIQLSRIRGVLRVSKSDAAAFLVTLLATWVLPLDQAIEVGIGISIVLFLRRARLLSVRELTPDLRGRLREFAVNAAPGAAGSPIRFIHLEGSLFFGAATELRDGLDTIADDPGTQVLVLRIKRAQHVDYSTAEVLAALSHRMRKRGQHLLLVGMSPDTLSLLERAGVVAAVGDEHVFPTETGLFEAAAKAVRRAVELTGRDDLEDPLIAWARKEGTNANSAAGDELIVRRDEA
ncbi:MAG: SulP family inorganic anion transporter, partial [Myxococcota bacterium]